MWQGASDDVSPSVGAVLEHLVAEFEGNRVEVWHHLGTAFRVEGDAPHPLFVTNEHVVREQDAVVGVRRRDADAEGAEELEIPAEREELAILAQVQADGGYDFEGLGCEILTVNGSRDLAILGSSPDGRRVEPVSFADREPLPTGAPVAAIGFPLQESPEMTPEGGRLTIERRFAAGWISTHGSIQEAPDGSEFAHYEVDMKAYPGISGSPLFDENGDVVGLMRRSMMHGSAAVYGYAVRNHELGSALEDANFQIDLPT